MAELIRPPREQSVAVPPELLPQLRRLTGELSALSDEETIAIALAALTDLLDLEASGALVLVVAGSEVDTADTPAKASAAAYFTGRHLELKLYRPVHRPRRHDGD